MVFLKELNTHPFLSIQDPMVNTVLVSKVPKILLYHTCKHKESLRKLFSHFLFYTGQLRLLIIAFPWFTRYWTSWASITWWMQACTHQGIGTHGSTYYYTFTCWDYLMRCLTLLPPWGVLVSRILLYVRTNSRQVLIDLSGTLFYSLSLR